MSDVSVGSKEEAASGIARAVQDFSVGRYRRVVETCLCVLEWFPDHADVYNLLALAQFRLGELDAALKSIMKAIEISPEVDSYYSIFGDIAVELGKYELAVDAYLKGASLCEDEIGRRDCETKSRYALEKMRASIGVAVRTRVSPFAEATENCKYTYGRLSIECQEFILSQHESMSAPEEICRSVARDFDIELTPRELVEIIVLAYLDEGRSELAYEIAQAANRSDPGPGIHNLVLRTLLTVSKDTQQVFFDESVEWSQRYGLKEPEDALVLSSPVIQYSDMVMGFVCDYADTIFGEVAFFPMFEQMLKLGVKVVFYNFGRWEFESNMDGLEVKNITGLSEYDLHKNIISDGVHVLFDLNGRLRENHRLGSFLRRSAPIQVNYFNLCGTTGIDAIDYIFADDVLVPETDEPFYTEQVLRLSCGVNGAFRFKREVPVSLSPCERKGYVTFSSCNSFFKYNDGVFDVWAEILQRAEGLRLIIKCGEIGRPRVVERIRREFVSRGVSLDRIELVGWSDLEGLHRFYDDIDLALDTLPYSGGTTCLNALWQGVPTLTVRGKGWRSSGVASIMHSAGLDSMIMPDVQSYIERAVELALSPSLLAQYRENIKQNIEQCHYFKPEVVYPQMAEILLDKLKQAPGICG